MSGSMSPPQAAPMPPSMMGGGSAPGGATPQMGPRPNTGSPTQGSSNPGSVAGAMLKIKNAANMLQSALTELPMGDPVHQDILQIVTKLSKHASQIPENPGLQQQSLLAAMRGMGQNPMQAALNRMLPQPGQGPAMPGPPGQ